VSSAPSKSSSDTPCQSCTSSQFSTAGCLQLIFTAFQGNLDFCPLTDKIGQCKLLPKHQLVTEWCYVVFKTLVNMPDHVYLTPVPDSTSEPSAFSSRNIPNQAVVSRTTLCTLFFSPSFVSLFSQKCLRSAITLWVLRYGRLNTCVGCLPKVTPVRLPPVLATCQSHRPKRSWRKISDTIRNPKLIFATSYLVTNMKCICAWY